ncbi:MAG: FAD-dependent oxidoreductase [Gammaproteobacteria bacterium]|nr:FAD-dependent oxidoreductase [Gammaproteobacteria bacterium]
MNKNKISLVVVFFIAITFFFIFDLQSYFTIDFFRSQQTAISGYYNVHPLNTAIIFFFIYVAITGLSLPGAAIMTLIGGAIFGLLWGTVIVSFASTIGATIAFISSRFVLRGYVQERFSKNLKAINKGMKKDGAFYLFTLRLVPLFPFFIINLVMGLTTIRVITFFLVSQIGMLPGTIVYVNAGTQIAQIDSLRGILSPGVIIAFTLLGIFPLIAKKIVEISRAYRVYKNYKKPRQFDRNLIVIGAGSAGLVTAYIAAAVKAKVTLIEKDKMGGDCLNTGCVPSKTLIRSARFLSHSQRAQEFGFRSAHVEFDFADVMERVQRIIRTIEPHDSIERYTELGVECIQGKAWIRTPWSVEVNGQTLTTQNIVIAAGARPFVPAIAGLDKIIYYTSDSVWSLRVLPGRLIVLGGGPVGCELVQCFARFGSQVTQIEMFSRLLLREDPEISEIVMNKFKEEGITVLTNHTAKEIVIENGKKILVCESQGKDIRIEFDTLLVAVGRKANTEGYGLEELHIPMTPQGTIEVNDYMQTVYPNIYACGDVAGPYLFTHTAAHQAWYASVNALFGIFRKFKADYSVIPWATFTEPEIARVGLNEQEAKEKNIAYEITTYGMDDLDRAIADEEAHGLVKILTVPGKDRILGVTIVGEHAADLITEYISALRNNIGLNRILGTIHIYPTLAEANKYAAGNWKKAHVPAKFLKWVETYHSWRRD